jgi:hypothetical protein
MTNIESKKRNDQSNIFLFLIEKNIYVFYPIIYSNTKLYMSVLFN